MKAFYSYTPSHYSVGIWSRWQRTILKTVSHVSGGKVELIIKCPTILPSCNQLLSCPSSSGKRRQASEFIVPSAQRPHWQRVPLDCWDRVRVSVVVGQFLGLSLQHICVQDLPHTLVPSCRGGVGCDVCSALRWLHTGRGAWEQAGTLCRGNAGLIPGLPADLGSRVASIFF